MALQLQLDVSRQQILRIALPISAAIFVPQINFVVNTIFVAQLGADQLAVAGIVGIFYLLFAVTGYGFSNGLQSLIAGRAGQNKWGQIGILYSQGNRIALAMALLGIGFTWFVLPSILRQVLHHAEVSQAATAFLRVRIVGLLFLYLFQCRNAFLIGINRSRLLLYGIIAETVVNRTS